MATESESISSENILSILVATDCHLGYAEKDPIRQDDSFTTFEEILQLAQNKEVDMILLGGDLFHDNKPSRRTIHKTLSLFRKYCLGDKECQLEYLSDPAVNFEHCDFPIVNYQDPNYNIAYPVFSVHGNHDDPTGEGSLSAIDILSTAGLLNHFGKATNCDNIDMSPVLLKKGETKLALYGLGAMRDERLHKTFVLKRVKMLRPREDPDSWFNAFVIHQNRAKHGPKNYIPESFLDEFLDLVIWGHEHECLIDPTWSESSKPFFISQPGSSVATSLSIGESKKKHVGLLQINQKQFRMQKLELKTVRQFMMDDVVLANTGFSDTEEDKIYEYLTEKVEQMISEAETLHTGHEKQPRIPLVRVKVEHTGGYEVINPHRFGQQFVKRVANCKDILLFYRKRVVGTRGEKNYEQNEPNFHFDQPNAVKMEDLINEYLNANDEALQLNVLSERKLSKALNAFVMKDEKDAIPDLVKHLLRKVQTDLKSRDLKEGMIDAEIDNLRSKDDNVDERAEDEELEEVFRNTRDNTTKKAFDDDSDIEIVDEIDGDIASSKSNRGRGKASRSRRGSRTSTRDTRGKGRGKKADIGDTQRTVSDSFMSTNRNSTSRRGSAAKTSSTPSLLAQNRKRFQDMCDDDEDNPFDFEDTPPLKKIKP